MAPGPTMIARRGMNMEVEVIVASAILLPILLVASWGIISLHRQFRWDKNNPYRRYCRKCGQEQNVYAECWSCPRMWWEDVNEIIDPICSCHKYTR